MLDRVCDVFVSLVLVDMFEECLFGIKKIVFFCLDWSG